MYKQHILTGLSSLPKSSLSHLGEGHALKDYGFTPGEDISEPLRDIIRMNVQETSDLTPLSRDDIAALSFSIHEYCNGLRIFADDEELECIEDLRKQAQAILIIDLDPRLN